jgi:hypothetical protein
MRMTFRKRKAGAWGEHCFDLNRDGIRVATIAEDRDERGSWYWYGDGINTCGIPMGLEEAKANALKHFRSKAT